MNYAILIGHQAMLGRSGYPLSFLGEIMVHGLVIVGHLWTIEDGTHRLLTWQMVTKISNAAMKLGYK